MSKANQKTVKWFLVEKNPPMIKFVEDDEPYPLADHVVEASNFEKYPINKDDTVSVSIEGDEVVYLRKVKATSTKKSEPSSNVSSSADETTKKIFSVSKYGIKFVGEKSWTNFCDDLQGKDVKSMGAIAKETVTITLNKDGKIVEINPTTKTSSSPSAPKVASKSSYRDEKATDNRTVLMCAKDIIIAFVESGSVNKENIDDAMKSITKTCKDSLDSLSG